MMFCAAHKLAADCGDSFFDAIALLSLRFRGRRLVFAEYAGERRSEKLWGIKAVGTVSPAAALENTPGTGGASNPSIDAFADGADGGDLRRGARGPRLGEK
jgi:hypothetical protein